MTSVLFSCVLPHCDVSVEHLVVREVEGTARRRVAVQRVPLTIDDGVGNAGVLARERPAEIVRACDAEVGERQVVEVEAPGRVDRQLGVAAAVAGRDLAAERRRAGHPLERLAAVERAPDEAAVRVRRVGRAHVQPVRVRSGRGGGLLRSPSRRCLRSSAARRCSWRPRRQGVRSRACRACSRGSARLARRPLRWACARIRLVRRSPARAEASRGSGAAGRRWTAAAASSAGADDRTGVAAAAPLRTPRKVRIPGRRLTEKRVRPQCRNPCSARGGFARFAEVPPRLGARNPQT